MPRRYKRVPRDERLLQRRTPEQAAEAKRLASEALRQALKRGLERLIAKGVRPDFTRGEVLRKMGQQRRRERACEKA